MKRIVVVCPGRGTYNQTELGYIGAHHKQRWQTLIGFDDIRAQRGQVKISELDSEPTFAPSTFSRGDNASALIFAASYLDFMALSEQPHQIVAVTGNSMGWYTALSCAGALSGEDGFVVANTMGQLMQQKLIGGQLVYPVTNEDWETDPAMKQDLLNRVSEIDNTADHVLSLSIDLGGFLVLAGNTAGLRAFEKTVPVLQGRFPLRLANHAAFHTPLQQPVAEEARSLLSQSLFRQPTVPLVDGRGSIWWPGSSSQRALWDYTLGHQVTSPYDFTRAITVAAREFAPDAFVLLGPGTTLGSAIGQSLALAKWRGIVSKRDFLRLQSESPVLIAMGIAEQRCWINV